MASEQRSAKKLKAAIEAALKAGYKEGICERQKFLNTLQATNHQALHDAFLKVNKGNKKLDRPEGRLFIAKAVILLSEAYKCRDADHVIIYLYDQKGISDEQVEALLEEVTETDRKAIPEYTFDCHTARGKAMGKTKEDFLRTEFESLTPKIKGLFEDLVD
jgi:hypothetical protein